MSEAPGRERMTQVLERAVLMAREKMGSEAAAGLAEVLRVLCLDLSDLETRYFVVFEPDGGTGFATADPVLEPMLTIATTAAVFHDMAIGKSNPAIELARRRVKMSGVPVARLAKVGGPLIDTLFSCYRECVAG